MKQRIFNKVKSPGLIFKPHRDPSTIKLASLLLNSIMLKHREDKIFQFKRKKTHSYQKVPEHPLQRNGRKSKNR